MTATIDARPAAADYTPGEQLRNEIAAALADVHRAEAALAALVAADPTWDRLAGVDIRWHLEDAARALRDADAHGRRIEA